VVATTSSTTIVGVIEWHVMSSIGSSPCTPWCMPGAHEPSALAASHIDREAALECFDDESTILQGWPH
jgi:hypothetical protein